MPEKEKTLFCWSGGKDSALALYDLFADPRFEGVSLLTTVAESYERVSHHGVRTDLLQQQAEAVGVQLHKLYLPGLECTNEHYEELMKRTMLQYREIGVRTVAFGDIFLEDLRTYRERNLAKVGMKAVFPIWHRNTAELLHSFINSGFKAFVSCVDGRKLSRDFAGRSIDEGFLRDLPEDVDPCGENGEYHTFVCDGPYFQRPIDVTVGEIVERDVRFFADLLPSPTISREIRPRQCPI